MAKYMFTFIYLTIISFHYYSLNLERVIFLITAVLGYLENKTQGLELQKQKLHIITTSFPIYCNLFPQKIVNRYIKKHHMSNLSFCYFCFLLFSMLWQMASRRANIWMFQKLIIYFLDNFMFVLTLRTFAIFLDL